MTQRKFEYQDDKSSKFWHITLEDCSYTVIYGKIDTKGRTQSKSFETEAEAKKSYENLIQQKLKKGYTEVATDNQKVEAAKNKSAKTKKTPVEPKATIPKTLEVTRSIDLNPGDWHWATWKPRTPLPKPEVKPFDIKKAKKQLEKVVTSKPCSYQPQYISLEDWSKAKIDNFLSKEEALFWLIAISSNASNYKRDEKEKELEFIEKVVNEYSEISISIDIAVSRLIDREYQHMIPTIIASVVYALFPFVDFISALNQRILSDNNAGRASGLLVPIIEGFEKHLWHYLTDTEIKTMSQQLDSVLNIEATQFTHATYYLAAYLGMHDRVSNFVKDKSALCLRHYNHHNTVEYEILAGLGSADEVESQMRRLNFEPCHNPNYIRLCFATTEYSALDLIHNGILHQNAIKDDATKLLKTFVLVKAPEAAPYMLELWLSSKVPSLARQWLDNNPLHSIIGLIPVAAGELAFEPIKAKPNELSRAAIEYLIGLKRKGYEDLIRQAIAQQPAEIAAVITKEVLDVEELKLEPLDEQTTPQWLQQGVSEIERSHQTYKLLSWVSCTDLPPLLINKKCFNESQVNAVLVALSKSTLDSPHPILKNIKHKCDKPVGMASLRASVDNFIWSLFQRWLTDGAPKKENWAMLALGLLGSDEIAIKFTPYLRKWPGESQHHRAVLGLQCLRAIGSDTALMQINGIARKIKYKGLKARAQECISAIAKDRKLSPDELEDRIIPSLGLDAKGQRVFDYGDRQFNFVLGQDLKPMVRDETGKLRANLPKPAKKDNEELATQALADWKLLKKQVRETLKIQTVRLEQAMTAQRRWQWREFEDLLANHPFMTHLVQRIIWAGYDKQNNLVQTFRLAEDRTYADPEDEEISLSGIATVGIIYPVHLTPEQMAAWGETLSDYEIIPPFSQIDREIYAITPEEAETVEITRFEDITIPGITLLRTMESLGWPQRRVARSWRFCS